MKYRIEDGNATMPISELNRLNDGFKQLKTEMTALGEAKSKLKKDIKSNFFMTTTITNDWMFQSDYHYDLSEDATEILKPLIKQEIKDHDLKLKRMSILEFIKWRLS